MKTLYFPILLISFLACSSSKNASLNDATTASCDTEARVLDYTGLDACRFLLELKDGTRLLPITLSDPGFLFSEEQVVKIQYKLVKDAVTACMTAAIPAEITCITEIKKGTKPGQLFAKKVCSDTEAPLSLAWVKKTVMHNKVSEVKRGYKESTPYYIMYGNVYVLLYSCEGAVVCEYAKSEKNTSCEGRINQLTDLQSLWAEK